MKSIWQLSKTHTLKTMWYVSSETNKKHRISTFAEFIREIKQSEETKAQRDFFWQQLLMRRVTFPALEANTSQTRPHATTPEEQVCSYYN